MDLWDREEEGKGGVMHGDQSPVYQHKCGGDDETSHRLVKTEVPRSSRTGSKLLVSRVRAVTTVSDSFAIPWTMQSARLLCLWNSLGQNTGVGSCSLLQGIFPTQGSNLGLLHCRRILYQLSHHRSPRILEWIAYPFCRASSQPRNRIGVSCNAGRFFTY